MNKNFTEFSSSSHRKKKSILCATVRNEGPGLLEWIAYHRVIGFDSIIIASNDNNDGSDLLLDTLHKNNVITHIVNNTTQGKLFEQLETYEMIFDIPLVREHEWICVLDADEFIVLNRHKNINEFLDDYKDLDVIALDWLQFSSSGQKQRNGNLVIERFLECNQNWRLYTKITTGFKSFSKIESVETVWTHYPKFKENSDNFLFPSRKFPKIVKDGYYIDPSFHDYSVAHINHYVIKSLEEFLVKRVNRSRPNPPDSYVYPIENFYYYNVMCSGDLNDDILRLGDAVKNEVSFLIDKYELNESLLLIDEKYSQYVDSLLLEEHNNFSVLNYLKIVIYCKLLMIRNRLISFMLFLNLMPSKN